MSVRHAMLILKEPSPSPTPTTLPGVSRRVAVSQLNPQNSAFTDTVVLTIKVNMALQCKNGRHTSSATARAGLSVLLNLMKANAVVASTVHMRRFRCSSKTRGSLYYSQGRTNLTLSSPPYREKYSFTPSSVHGFTPRTSNPPTKMLVGSIVRCVGTSAGIKACLCRSPSIQVTGVEG